MQAKELTNKDLIGKSDPFAELYIRPLRNRMKKSRTIVSYIISFLSFFGGVIGGGGGVLFNNSPL